MQQLWTEEKGSELLLQGNEAIARGALEAGAVFCAGYPGNPSSEIIETLAEAAKDLPIYVEWSINEKVALEAATAASFTGCRAIACMKQNGVNVVSDFLTNLTLSGTKGGLVLVSCDDPAGISSTNEEDSRLFAKLAGIPLLEPSTPQEALAMTKWAFELSETIGNVVMVRSVSRLSHSRSNVSIGALASFEITPVFDTRTSFHTFPVIQKHAQRNEKLHKTEEIFNNSSFNQYHGPLSPDLLIISSGCSSLYAEEAIARLNLSEKAGLLKLGTSWPLPKKLLLDRLKKSDLVLFVEEVDPFIEEEIKAFSVDFLDEIGKLKFFGKASSHLPKCGELSPTILEETLTKLIRNGTTDIKVYSAEEDTEEKLLNREFGFCPGCPHRASFYAINMALKLDGRDGFVCGDIGCYTMGIWPSGFNQVKSVHAMGSGVGLGNGYGQLKRFGFKQPVISVCGDSTFFHAGLPPLVNARFNQSDLFLIVLDNSATAMTGFQPHPGTGVNAMRTPTETVEIEKLCQAINITVASVDPYNLKAAQEKILEMLIQSGPRVLILKRNCALVQGKQGGFPFEMAVNHSKCRAEDCGCNRYCTRIFRCPGLIWDHEMKAAQIDEVICVGCGICSQICPNDAIEKTFQDRES